MIYNFLNRLIILKMYSPFLNKETYLILKSLRYQKTYKIDN